MVVFLRCVFFGWTDGLSKLLFGASSATMRRSALAFGTVSLGNFNFFFFLLFFFCFVRHCCLFLLGLDKADVLFFVWQIGAVGLSAVAFASDDALHSPEYPWPNNKVPLKKHTRTQTSLFQCLFSSVIFCPFFFILLFCFV